MNLQKITLADPLVTLRESADIMDGVLSYATLRVYAFKGKLPFPAEKLGGRWYARRADVEQYAKTVRDAAFSLSVGKSNK